ncbi:MAG: PaaI family thioesterase [Herpetosiphonaceae bacterium]|nr:PaaI family thioesterase [Herpetosiphonaceae bacterium]
MTEEQDQQEHEAAALFASLPPEGQQHALRVLRHMNNRDQWTGSFGWLIGIHYIEREPGHITCMIDVDESHYNPAGVAHGGVVYSLIDSAMGGTVHSYLEPGQRCVTAELKVNYLRPVRAGRITAVANLIQHGRTLAVVTAEVHNAQDQLVAIGLGTFAIIQRR